MLSKNRMKKDEFLTPSYASRVMSEPIPKNFLPKKQMSADQAYDLIHDELMLGGYKCREQKEEKTCDQHEKTSTKPEDAKAG